MLWATALIGFIMPFTTGFLGLMPLDQSIIFEAGGRISRGDVPFTDFYCAYGLVPALMQAGLFKLFGISWFSYVLHAGLVNGCFAAAAFDCLRLMLPAGSHRQAFGGALLAAWGFYPMMGTPFMDNHSFFFGFIAFWAVVAAFKRDNYLLWLLCFPCLVLGFYSKPLPVVFWIFPVLMECWLNRKALARHLKWILFSIALALAVAVLPFIIFDAYHFYYYTFYLPSRLASSRVGMGDAAIPLRNEWYKVWVALLVLAPTYFLLDIRRQDSMLRLAYFRVFLILLVSVIAAVMTHNTFLPLVAPVLGIALAVFSSLDTSRTKPRFIYTWKPLVFGIVWTGLVLLVSWYNFSRKANEMIFRPADLQNYSPELGLFLKTAGTEYTVNEMRGLVHLMKQENCLYMGDMMFLYSVVNKDNPWPVTHLHDHTSYYSADSATFTALKKKLVENIIRYKVTAIAQTDLLWGEEELVVFVNTLKSGKKYMIGRIAVYELDENSLKRIASNLKTALER